MKCPVSDALCFFLSSGYIPKSLWQYGQAIMGGHFLVSPKRKKTERICPLIPNYI